MRRSLILASLLALACSSVSIAQTQPTPPLGDPLGLGQAPATPASPGRAASPFWNNSPAGGSDLPAADIRAVAPARMQATAVRWQYFTAQDRLGDALRDLRLDLENSPEWSEALAAEEQAYRAFVAAREKALAPLRDDPAYRGAVRLQESLATQIQDEHTRPSDRRDLSRIESLARVKLQAGESNRALEIDALQRDAEYQQARARLQEASANLLKMRRDFRESVRKSDDLRQLRDEIAELRIARLATQAYLESTVNAANTALDYAYWYRGQERFVSPTGLYLWNQGSWSSGWNHGGYYPWVVTPRK